jgi:putative ABC transport system permease protein
MEALIWDLRYALRRLWGSPGFTAVVALTMALGVGANTAMFSVVNAVLLRPLPYGEPDRLFRVMSHHPESGFGSHVHDADFLRFRDRVSSFETIAAYRGIAAAFRDGEAESYVGQRITNGMFRTLRVEPVLGRDFLPEEFTPSDPDAIVISHRLWRTRFGGDPEIIGGRLRLDGLFPDGPGAVPAEMNPAVVGVMPRDFEAPRAGVWGSVRAVDFWLPYEVESAPVGLGTVTPQAIARLKEGVSAAEAIAEMNAVAAALGTASFDSDSETRFSLRPINDDLVQGTHARVLWTLWGAVGFVTLIAVANVANLLLARTVTREREMAIRAAVGASRTRLIRQLLTEGAVLGAVGGAAGLLAAYAALPTIASSLPPEVPRAADIGLDGSVLAFTIGLSLLAGILFGLAPAWAGAREGFALNRARAALSGAQVGLAVVLLVGAGLLLRSFMLLLTGEELGFDPNHVLTTRIDGVGLRTPDPMEHLRYYEDVVERLRALPAVESAAVARFGASRSEPQPSPVRVAPDGEYTMVRYQIVGDDYFRTLRIPFLGGRGFGREDDFGSPPVAIVNESLARLLWRGEDPIGKQLHNFRMQPFSVPHTVVGIVPDVREGGPGTDPHPVLYLLHRQEPERGIANLLIRTRGHPEASMDLVRAAIRSVDPEVATYPLETLESAVRRSVASPRFRTLVLGTFAAIAAALALVGIYAVAEYAVSRRTREIGVRMAVGAHAGDVVRLMTRQAAIVALLGTAAGVLVSLWLTRFLEGMLFGIAGFDAWTYAVVCVALPVASLLASYIPARRATRVDPTSALRHE